MASKSFANGAETTSPAAKRRRIALACTACRLRKSRCDGRRPSCSSCVSLNFDCQYEPSESAANIIVRKEYISDLDQRVTSVEQVVQQLNFILEGHLTACSGDAQCRPYRPFPATTASTAPDQEQDDSARAIGLEEPQDEDATTNGMAMTFVKEHTSAFFGGSSNINFTRLILGAVNHIRHAARREQGIPDKQLDLNENNMAKASLSYANPVVASPNYAPRSMTALPSTEEMDCLLDIYFDTAGVVFPFIHEETMRKTYADGKANGWTRVRRTWLGILNMIFAMASNFDRESLPSAQQRQQKSNVFFKRARDLCDELSKQVISLEIVHYLLLFVIHCQGSQRSVQAWNVHGLVVRSAMALGLHSTPARESTDDYHVEYCRRTWVVIYCMDKVLSVAFGRPVSIPDEFMVDRSRPSEPAFQDGLHSDVDIPGKFLDLSFRLYKIMNKSLQKQYAGNVETSDAESDDMASLHASGEFKKELRNWSSSLPPYLRLYKPEANNVLENAPVNRLCVILTLRYHNINILIHRPLLGNTIRYLFGGTSMGIRNPSFLVQLAMAEAHECIRSAQNTVELVYGIISQDETSRNNLGMWYFTLHYVFTASLVILGRILWAQHGGDVDEAALAHCKALLGQVETIFQKLDQDNSLVFSCSRYLRNMLEVCTSQDATMTVQNDGHEESTLSIVPRLDQQPADSASEPNAFESMTYLGIGDIEMFELYSSETYDHEIFASMERFSDNSVPVSDIH